MRRGVLPDFPEVVHLSQHLAVLDEDRPDRHLSQSRRQPGVLQGQPHVRKIFVRNERYASVVSRRSMRFSSESERYLTTVQRRRVRRYADRKMSKRTRRLT